MDSVYCNLTLKSPFTKLAVFAASVDKDQATQNMQPDFRSTLFAMLKHYLCLFVGSKH